MTKIPRISAPDRHTFWHQYVEKGQPVIISDLFEGQAIHTIDSREKALAAFPDMALQFKGEYVEHFLDRIRGRPIDPRIGETLTFAQYCQHVQEHPETAGWLGQEEAPDSLCSLFQVPSYCTNHEGESDPHMMIHTFIGHPGKSASLHIDTDYKQVLVYEIYGRKRVYLIPSRSGQPLKTAGFISRLNMHSLNHEEREQLVTELGGCWATLTPGDTLFLPFSYYHHFEYLDHAMSINIRFGRNRYHEVFSRYMIPHWSLHALAALMTPEHQVQGKHRDLYTQLMHILSTQAASATERVHEICNRLDGLAYEVGALVEHPQMAQRLQDHYYSAPQLADAFLTRFRLQFQKCDWHRNRLDLSPCLERPDGLKQARNLSANEHQPAPDFQRQDHWSVWVSNNDLSYLPAQLITEEQQWLKMWLSADFDCHLKDEQQLEVLLARDGQCVPLEDLLANNRCEDQNKQALLSLAEKNHIHAGSLILIAKETAYDGRVSGNTFFTFLGSISMHKDA